MSTLARSIALAVLMVPGSRALAGVPAMAAVPDPSADPHARMAAASAESTTLDLEDVLRRVLARNPTLAAARAAWAESRARARQAGALDDPMLEVMAAPRSFGSSSVESAYRVGVTQAFPLFGQRGLRRRVADAETRSAAWDLRTAQLDLVRDARMAYLDYWRIGCCPSCGASRWPGTRRGWWGSRIRSRSTPSWPCSTTARWSSSASAAWWWRP